MSEVRALTSGTLVEVDEKGKATFMACAMHVMRYPTYSERDAAGDPGYDEAYAASCEDGPSVYECGARMVETHGGDGWRCFNGHSYVSMERRAKEGWDYGDDAEEVAHLQAQGVPAVAWAA